MFDKKTLSLSHAGPILLGSFAHTVELLRRFVWVYISYITLENSRFEGLKAIIVPNNNNNVLTTNYILVTWHAKYPSDSNPNHHQKALKPLGQHSFFKTTRVPGLFLIHVKYMKFLYSFLQLLKNNAKQKVLFQWITPNGIKSSKTSMHADKERK